MDALLTRWGGLDVLVNNAGIARTGAVADLELGAQMRSAIRRCLGLPAEVLGHLDHDDGVIHSVCKRHPLVVEHPESKVTKNIERIARKLLADGAAQAQPPDDGEGRHLGHEQLPAVPAEQRLGKTRGNM